MDDHALKRNVDELWNNMHTFQSNLAGWVKILPAFQGPMETVDWAKRCIDSSPSGVTGMVDPNFVNTLCQFNADFRRYANIPPPPLGFETFPNTAGSAVNGAFTNFLTHIKNSYFDNPVAQTWAVKGLEEGKQLSYVQDRSVTVGKRLAQIMPRHAHLYDRVVQETLIVKAVALDPEGAGAILDQIMTEFNGGLLRFCPSEKREAYQRIADHLASDFPSTKQIVRDGEGVYIQLTKDILAIRKSKPESALLKIEDLLRRFDDHVMTITNAIDPAKVGFTFAT
jgi:hypothetical protein